MITIEYRVQYTGAVGSPRQTSINYGTYGTSYETVRVEAININAGFTKAIKVAREPLGNGQVREIGSVEFMQVI